MQQFKEAHQSLDLYTDIMLARSALGSKPNYLLPEVSTLQAALDQLLRCAATPAPRK